MKRFKNKKSSMASLFLGGGEGTKSLVRRLGNDDNVVFFIAWLVMQRQPCASSYLLIGRLVDVSIIHPGDVGSPLCVVDLTLYIQL